MNTPEEIFGGVHRHTSAEAFERSPSKDNGNRTSKFILKKWGRRRHSDMHSAISPK
jgi:hypothetical protein